MKQWQRVIGGLSALAVLFSGYSLFMVAPAEAAPAPDQGMIVVTLSQNPASKATVTATRQANVPADITGTGKAWPKETVNLTGGTGAKATNMGYTSPILKYTFSAGSGCRNLPQPYDNWEIKVSLAGSAIASPKIVSVICGATVSVPMTVVLPKDAAKFATLSGASSFAGTACDSGVSGGVGSQYWLLPTGTDSNTKGAGKGLAVDANSKSYSIKNLAPSPPTYDFYVDCVYRPNGATTPIDHFYTKTGVVLAAGTTTKVDFTDASSGSGGGNADDACANATGVYSWVLCPTMTFADKFLTTAYDNWIQPFLAISPLTGEPDLIKVWKLFVSLADVFFVIAFLVLIFGTALNLNAYTIKKALPRLVIAVIVVQFSYFLCGFIVDIGNVLGMGIEAMVQGALKVPTSAVASGVDHPLIKGLISGGAVVFVGAGALWVLGPAIIMLLLGLVLSVFSFIFTLIVRKLLIDILILLSPIAIVAWVLPNTEKFFKQWSTNFVRAIMIYPIVSLLIVGGSILQRAFSGPTAGQSGQLLAGIAPIIAFFMMPMAFKWGGQVMGVAGKIGAKSGLAGLADKSMAAGKKPGKDLMANTSRNMAAASAARRTDRAGGTGFGARRAQIQAGYGFGVTTAGKKLRDKQIQLARDKSEKEEQTAFAHKAENATDADNQAVLGKAGTSLNQRKAIANQLATTGKHPELAAARSDFMAGGGTQEEWAKTLGKNYGTLMEKAPHAVLGMDGTKGAAQTMTAPQLQSSTKKTKDALTAHIFTAGAVDQDGFNRLVGNIGQISASSAGKTNWDRDAGLEMLSKASATATTTGSTDDVANHAALLLKINVDGTLK